MMNEKHGTMGALRVLVSSHEKAGDNLVALRQWEAALEHFRVAFDSQEELMKQDNTEMRLVNSLRASCTKLGDCLTAQGEMDEVEVYYSKAFNIT